MGSEVPKQFLLLNGRPILRYTIVAFLEAYADIKIILVLPAKHLDRGNELVSNLGLHNQVSITSGGATRFHSVKNGLHLVNEPSIIFVHDGVRCLVTTELIRRCYEQAIEHGSAIPAVAPTDSLRLVDGTEHHVIDRTSVRMVQTPQTFTSEVLLPAFTQQYQPYFTDEATVVEAASNKIHLVEGDYDNIKITRPIDITIAERVLEQRLPDEV